MTTKLKCPTCKAEIEWSEEYPERPFCSKRCRDIDFGGWANEEFKIIANSGEQDIMSEDLDPGQ